MTKTFIASVLVSLLLLCASSKPARAQTNCYHVIPVGCSWYTLPGGNCLPQLPANAFDCVTDGPWSLACLVVTNSCTSPPRHWCPTCGKWVSSAGGPINLTNGNTYIQETDVQLKGLGGGLTLERTWNSMVPQDESGFQSGMFGLQWRSTYEERVFQGSGQSSGYMVYLQSDGGLWYFNSSGTLVAPTNESATLTQNGTTSWTMTFQNGGKKVFSYTTGSLTSIVDRNNNTTNLTYDATNRLTTVTDPVSRHLYFSYGSQTSPLVTSVTSDFGVSVSYAYDAQGRLTQVTEPDQSTFNFDYNTQSLIADVKDSQGVILESHTYDSLGRGLTSSRANGVEAVTISYPQ